jgi:hypothetical protein
MWQRSLKTPTGCQVGTKGPQESDNGPLKNATIKAGGGGYSASAASLHSTDNVSVEDSEQQEQSRPQQHMWNSKIFVVFPLKSTAAHSLHEHIQHLFLNVD